jgi:HTH-type transcriptional regulator/antitoxin MqsA
MSEEAYVMVPAHVCPACGESGSLVREVRDLPFEYRGESIVIEAVHGEFCTACGEGFADTGYPADWKRMADAMVAFAERVDADSAAALRATRKKLGLRQAEAGKLFGGGVSAFSEYERGKTQPHKSTVLLLKLLDKHPELLEEIR